MNIDHNFICCKDRLSPASNTRSLHHPGIIDLDITIEYAYEFDKRIKPGDLTQLDDQRGKLNYLQLSNVNY